jgi:pyruvate kinase
MQRLTKIVATIGPATESAEVITQLINAGMNVARFNTKHNSPQWHQEKIQLVQRVAKQLGQPIAILLDLQGPEIRIDLPGGQDFSLQSGEEIVITSDRQLAEGKVIYVPAIVVETLQPGNAILLDDGVCEFEIVRKEENKLIVKAVGDFEVKNRKSVNTPRTVVDMPSLVEADLVQLDGAAKLNVDYVGLSYVRGKNDIDVLRQELAKRNLKAGIVAKIENQTALDNIDEIIAESDAVMVARGDLAVEVPFEQLAFWQKVIIAKCRLAAKPVITATQMLKSMVDSPRPTRAEVTDVANAVYDSTSAVMLSEETTIGKYPVKAVETQAKIAAFNEPYVEAYLADLMDKDASSGVAHAAMDLIAHRTEAIDSIICLTETGATAGLLARFRPKIPVHALTSNEQTYRKLALHFGIIPHIMEFPAGGVQEPEEIGRQIANLKIVEPGKNVLIIYGSIWKTPGLTNSLSLIQIPQTA